MKDTIHNTRLLLHRLGDLRSHVEDSVWDARQLDEMEMAELIWGRDPDIKIGAIQRSVTRTEISVADVEKLYQEWKQSGKSRRDTQIRQIIHRKYIEKEELGDIAKNEGLSKGQALEFLNIGVSELASIFFGIDGFHQAG